MSFAPLTGRYCMSFRAEGEESFKQTEALRKAQGDMIHILYYYA
jgi:hypothetical protein